MTWYTFSDLQYRDCSGKSQKPKFKASLSSNIKLILFIIFNCVSLCQAHVNITINHKIGINIIISAERLSLLGIGLPQVSLVSGISSHNYIKLNNSIRNGIKKLVFFFKSKNIKNLKS